jgi:diacylglycerol O-acyltransferase / wax synthase
MKRLNGWDSMLLYSETPNIQTHTVKIAILDVTDFGGDFTFELFWRTFWRRLHLLEPLRYKLVEIPFKLHHPMWIENSQLDLDYHLRAVRVRSPGGRRELDELTGEIAGTPLDRRFPLWEMYFVEGMADDRFPVITKVHHALADGSVVVRSAASRGLGQPLGTGDGSRRANTGRARTLAGRAGTV